jgi:outer membrane protein OmpA-like peptidoglycan-associated protein
MKTTKSSEKALVLVLLFITISVTSIYIYGVSTPQKPISATTEVVDSPVLIAATERIVVSTEKELVEKIIINPKLESVKNEQTTDNQKTKNTAVINNAPSEINKTDELKKEKSESNNILAIESSNSSNSSSSSSSSVAINEPLIIVNSKKEELIKEVDESANLANKTIEKVEVKKIIYDPIDLFISTELRSTRVFDKYDYGMYINTIKRSNGKIIDGQVQVYDNVRSKLITSMNTHSLSGINDPNNRSKSVRVISSVFGYRPQEISFSLDQPIYTDSTGHSSVGHLSDSLIRVNLNLDRLQMGDIAVMWKVFFYKDAAIMQAKSKPELDDLYTMMKENPNMRIKIHGHTNGTSHGKVIHLGEKDNHDLFNLKSDKHVETAGSAQKLSQYRAETIQHYLQSKGIDISRIEIKGWGGKKMLYDKHSAQAKLNVRVEVEVTEN